MARRAYWGVTCAVLLTATSVAAQRQPVGERVHLLPDQLPAPYASPSAANGPQAIARPADAGLAVPAGFAATVFADGLSHPREFEILSGGDVLLSESRYGQITLLRDADGDGRAELVETFADGFRNPYGMALRDTWLYVADGRGVWRLPYADGDTRAAGAPEPVTPDGALGSSRGHWTRNLILHPDGDRFYVAIGSAGNIAEEPAPRATIQEFALDGSAQRTLAAGLRNPVGLAFHPDTGQLYTVVNERDGLGDGLVPDYLTAVIDGAFYGWPYAYIGGYPQPGYAEIRPDLVGRTTAPDVLFRSHSAPIGLAFYDGDMFPEDYRGDAFVTFRGSWNSRSPTGYMVVRVPFEDGAPLGWYETFASGFWHSGENRARVWGRPTGIAVAADGALLVADDTGGTVWRISYQGT